MINAGMREYSYYTYSGKDSYGQPKLSETVQGSVKISINLISQSAQNNIKFNDASYIGLTLSDAVKDSFVFQYGAERLKVLYVNPAGRYKQVYMKNI